MLDTDNLFDDVKSEPEFVEKPEEPKTEEVEAPEDEPEEEETEEEGEEEETAEPPVADEDEEISDKKEKLIPEHRFKAALKDVTDKLEKAERELAAKNATPAPDRATDPEGYELHMRLEVSKAVMRETHADYDTVIAHYNKMTETNPSLNNAVAAAPAPAQYAYKLAKEDMELQEVKTLKGSPEWKQFQEFLKSKQNTDKPGTRVEGKKPVEKPKSAVPNLNRATSVAKSGGPLQSDEDLFKGAL